MKSILESKCKFTLASCMVSWLGLLSLTGQCSLLGITVTLVGLAGIAYGMLGIGGTLMRMRGASWKSTHLGVAAGT